MNYPMLFSPMKIGNVEIKNRIIQTSMGVDISNHDGTINNNTIAYYTERAKNGVGLIFTEYTRINESDGVSAVGQMSLASDRHIDGMTRLISSVHAQGAKIFVQLQHPGRQTVPIFPTFWKTAEALGRVVPNFWSTYNKIAEKATAGGVQGGDEHQMQKMQRLLKPNLAPSKLPENEPDVNLWYIKHRAMTIKEIHRIEQEFIAAAVRAKKAGADGVELHATHGYLLQQFLSPFTNRRTDAYGGSFNNRCRIVKNIINGIKAQCGSDFPVSVRLTVDEFEDKIGHYERGYHIYDGIAYAKAFEKFGADAINVSIGSTDTLFLVEESMRYPLGWRRNLAKAIKEAVSIPVIAVGVIRTPSQAEAILEEGCQDFIGLARSLLADPQWVIKAQEDREDEISRCIGCMRCMESVDENMLTNNPPECSLNPRLCKERYIPEEPVKNGGSRKAVVVGAGVAGLTAARELAKKGFSVTVFEKESNIGGQLNLADKPPFKDRILWAAVDLKAQAEALGVEIRFNEEATKEKIEALSPYCVIVATGGFAVHPKIPGADADYVSTVTPILNGEIKLNKKHVAVIGSGMTGLETTELLLKSANTVTVVERADKIAPGAGAVSTQEILPELQTAGVYFMPGYSLDKIENHMLYLSDKDKNIRTVQADFVVLSLGVRSNDISESLKGCCDKIYKVGDASKVGRIKDATRSAFLLARGIE